MCKLTPKEVAAQLLSQQNILLNAHSYINMMLVCLLVLFLCEYLVLAKYGFVNLKKHFVSLLNETVTYRVCSQQFWKI